MHNIDYIELDFDDGTIPSDIIIKKLFEIIEKYNYICALISDKEEVVDFYCNTEHPSGNSRYLERSSEANILFPESSIRKIKATTLDLLFKDETFDLIKMDIQGSELDALKGGVKLISRASHLILELQDSDYNSGAAQIGEVISWLNDTGWYLSRCMNKTNVDGDYLFKRKF
jgi:FkbM family methyltransferase